MSQLDEAMTPFVPEPTFLVFDTETTGLPARGKPVNHPDHAWPVQLGFVITDQRYNIMSEYDKIVCPPDGVECHERALEVHGIGPDRWKAEGIPMEEALADFQAACETIGEGIHTAYNLAFDDLIMRAAYARTFDAPEETTLELFGKSESLCTMLLTTGFLKVPAGNGGFRNVKLEQAYRRITGEKMAGAHDALSDVKGTLRVLKEIMAVMNA